MANYFVTGASSGIGRAVVSELVKHEHRVFAMTRDNHHASDLVARYGENNVVPVIADLQNIGALEKIIRPLVREYGFFAGLVHSGGIVRFESIRKLSYDRNLEMMQIHYLSFVELLRLLTLKKDRNAIFSAVAVTSAAAVRSMRDIVAYSTAKAAVEGFVRSASTELLENNVFINALRPGFVDTPMLEVAKFVHDDFDNWLKKQQPLGTIPSEAVASEVVHLLLRDNPYVTGTIVDVNGGMPVY